MANPAMQPAPADDETDQTADPGAAAPDDSGMDQDEGDQSGTVLCTILKNDDGTYTLVQGDEDDGEEGGEAAPGGADGADMGAGGDMGKPEGQTFSDPGKLLKGVLDILQQDAEASGGSAQDHFQAGYSGDNSPTPKKAMPAKM